MDLFKFEVCGRAAFYIRDKIERLDNIIQAMALGAGKDYPTFVVRKIEADLSSLEVGDNALNEHCIISEKEGDIDRERFEKWHTEFSDKLALLRDVWEDIDIGE